jgi:hypothetical protein
VEANGKQYTGVVIVHGIGDVKRNATLQEALNALTYWYNKVGGLRLEPTGAGRVWLSTRLTDSLNPDDKASRATMELVAPDSEATALAGDGAVRLRFREVWWAESFGQPGVGAAIRWAHVQFQDQMSHILHELVLRLLCPTVSKIYESSN